MKKPEYQLVLQFPCESIAQFDAVIDLEERLIELFVDSATEVDGHDSGSGEANIFILTPEPIKAFERAHAVVNEIPSLAVALRAAFRRVDADDYSIIWPIGATGFTVA
jgi:hypothetical protein